MAYTQILYHIVIRTKWSEKSINQGNVSSLLINYIKNQQKHHKKENTQKELKRIWKENGMEEDARYFS